MIIHLFNSSSVSGPERLVLPALADSPEKFMVVNLREERLLPENAPDPMEELSRSLGLRHKSIRLRSRWDRAGVKELRRLLEAVAPNLVHAHDVKASFYLLLANQRRFPIVSTHHGVHGRPGWKNRVYEWFYRRCFLPFFDRVLCVSTPDHDFMSKSRPGRERLRLHLNGADGRLVDPSTRETTSLQIRSRLLADQPGSESAFLFGVIGRLSGEKDHARLFHVLSILTHELRVRDWRCLIFGTGPLEKDLRRLASRLELEKRILWMGYRNNVGDEMSGLDMVVSFSKAEGLPISLIEAGWAGTPVLATNVGGVTDLIPDGLYGNLIPVDESLLGTASRIADLLSAAGKERLAAQGKMFQRRVLTHFTRKHWLQRLNEIYSELEGAAVPGGDGETPAQTRVEGGQFALPNQSR